MPTVHKQNTRSEIANMLYAVRTHLAKMTIAEAAQRAGMSAERLDDIEHEDGADVTVAELASLADGMGVKLNVMLMPNWM